MKKKRNISSENNLRKKALELIRKNHTQIKKIPIDDIKKLIEELQIHQVELELQNEELRLSQLELETARDNYIDLYDFTPVGYLTIDINGIIREANLTGTTLLKTERRNLIGRKFSSFIFKDDQDIFHLHCKKIVEKQSIQSCELRLTKKSGDLFWAKLDTVSKKGINNHTFLRIAITDISEHIEMQELIKQELIKKAGIDWKKTFNTVQDGICLLDRDQTIQRYNLAFSQFVTKNQDDIIGKKCWEVIHDAVKPIPGCPVVRMKKSLRRESIKIQLNQNWFEIVVDPIIDDDGTLIGAVHIMRDVTERKQVEEALIISEKRFKETADLLPAVIVELDLTGKITYINKYGLKISGLNKKTIEKGFAAIDLFEDYEKDRAKTNIQSIIQGEILGNNVYDATNIKGKKHSLMVSSSTIKTNDKITGIRSVLMDITELKKTENILKESENKLNLALQGGQADSWEWNLKTGEFYFGDAWAKRLGYKPGEIPFTNEAMLSIIHPDDIENNNKNLQVYIAGKALVYETEARLRKKDGDYIWVLSRGKIVEVDLDGTPVRIIGINFDITKRKIAEQKLRENEFRYRRAQEIGSVGNWEYNLQTSNVWGSDEAKRIFGFDLGSKEFTIDAVESCIPDRENVHQALVDLIGKEKPYNLEYEIITKDKGEAKFIHSQAVLEKDKNGNPLKINGVIQDISDRKQAEEKLEKSEKYYRTLFENISDGIFIFDVTDEGKFQFIDFNPAEEQIIGITTEQIIGKTPDDLVGKIDAQGINARYQRCVDEKKNISYDEEMYLSRGKSYFNTTLVPLLDENNNVFRIIGVARDISEKKKAEEVLIQQENLLRTIAENYPNSFVSIIEKDMTVSFSAGQEFKKLGLDPESFKGQSINEIFEDHSKEVKKHYLETFKGKETSFELFINDQHQHYRTVPLFDDNGEISKILVVVENITERNIAEKNLQNSEKRNRALLEAIPDLLFRLYKDGTYLDIEGPVKDLLLPKEELIGKKIPDVFPEEHSKPFMNKIQKSIETGELQTIEYQIPTTGGSEQYFEARISPLSDDEVFFIARNVTDRKLAEEDIKIKEEAIESSINAIGITDMEGKLIYVNDACVKLWGFENKKEIINRNLTEFWYGEGLNKTLRELQEKGYSRGEDTAISKNGTIFPVQYSTNIIKDDQGNPKHIFGSFIDITDRKQTEESLRESEERYRLLIENIPSVIWLTGMNGKTIFISNNVKKIYGYNPDEIYEKGVEIWLNRIHPEDIDRVKQEFALLFSNGKKYEIEYRIRRKDGKWIWLSDRATITKQIGNERFAFGVFSDITDRKQAEKSLQESEARFREFFIKNVSNNYWLEMKEPIPIDLPPEKQVDIMFKVAYIKEASDSAMQYYGLKKREDFIGQPLTVIWSPEATRRDHVTHHYFQSFVRANYELLNIEVPNTNQAGEDKWFFNNIRGIIENNCLVRIWGSQIDITEKKKAEHALKDSESILRSFFRSTPMLLGLVDVSDNDIIGVFFNNATIQYWDVEPEYFMGNSFRKFSKTKHLIDFWITKYKLAGKSKKPVSFEYEYSIRNEKRIYSMTVNFIFKISKHMERYSLIVEDITERKESEQQTIKSQEQMRQLAANIQNAREDERSGIAREIHDELGQVLTAVKMDLSWLQKRIKEQPLEINDKIKSSLNLVNDSIQTVKRISSELHPGILDDLGLAAAIEWQNEEFQKRTEILTELKINPENIYLDKNLSTAIFRIFQETLTNIARHSQASKVLIRLATKKNILEMIITDNGIGITKKQQDDIKSFGIQGIKERVDYFGGKIKIKGIKSRGTTIIVQIPLNDSDLG